MKYRLRSGTIVGEEDIAAMKRREDIEAARFDITMLSHYPMPAKGADEAIEQYLDELDTDSTIHARRCVIARKHAMRFWLNMLKTESGMRELLDICRDRRVYAFTAEAEYAVSYKTEDGAFDALRAARAATAAEILARMPSGTDAPCTYCLNGKPAELVAIEFDENKIMLGLEER